MRGINYYGLETEARNFVCSWTHPPEWFVAKFAELKFNQVRLPFSIQYVHEGNFEQMDRFMNAVTEYNINVTLDAHRIWSSHQAFDPTDGISFEEFVDAWTVVLKRYYDNLRLTDVDIFNEYQGTDLAYWNSMAARIVTTLEERFPERFIFHVGGVRWGGSLAGVSLEHLPFADRIRYTLHKYIFSTQGDWIQNWDEAIGSYPEKVDIGEFGFKEVDNEMHWARTFLSYLKSRGIRDSSYWCTAFSGDTDGLFLDSDCTTVLWKKYDILQSYWEEGGGGKRFLRGTNDSYTQSFS